MGNITASGKPMGIGDALLTAILGYAVVFLGLVLLMAVVIIVGKAMTKKSSVPSENAAVKEAPTAAPAELPKAPGSAGGIKLYGTPERDAAMVMAIVADRMGKPINEIRFISIKEVK
ncbi:MAG: OadG family protein [Oscillospiraceae bacterium]|nr:OadG family protein [Oscillospiraceae bacterium]